MKKIIFLVTLSIIIILVILPLITIKFNNKLIYISYANDISKYETNMCYHENYFYNEKHNISIYDFNIKKYFFFYLIILNYDEGNVCETEYLLEEEYIYDMITNAKIVYNNKNIDLTKLLENKKAIVSNTKYLDNDYNTIIEYILNDKHEIMYIFYNDDLTIIQIGNSDESPKYIAYK